MRRGLFARWHQAAENGRERCLKSSRAVTELGPLGEKDPFEGESLSAPASSSHRFGASFRTQTERKADHFYYRTRDGKLSFCRMIFWSRSLTRSERDKSKFGLGLPHVGVAKTRFVASEEQSLCGLCRPHFSPSLPLFDAGKFESLAHRAWAFSATSQAFR